MLQDKTVLLIISGGIAAYKSLELIRLLRKEGARVRPILTNGGAQFITPLSVASLAEHEVYTDLWSLKDETEMGHIRLSREADLVVIAPASADLMAKMAQGIANDLASTCMAANNKPVLIAPAMNQEMWANPANQDNLETLRNRGHMICGPADGEMACGETGTGRMMEATDILADIKSFFAYLKALSGKRVIVTSGPTYEPIDPVRFIGNRSSGKQGFAIAQALMQAGAEVHLISGPVSVKPPKCTAFTSVETAIQMAEAVENALPADIFISVAAVSDWRAETQSSQKIKKDGSQKMQLKLAENPDILRSVATHAQKRPTLVIGFAAETQNAVENAQAKRTKKACDWILANDVTENSFGADTNHIHFITSDNFISDWGQMGKKDIAQRLVGAIIEFCKKGESKHDTSTAENRIAK